jgi:RNA polymerase sigma-70 factor (ECF subfamily)
MRRGWSVSDATRKSEPAEPARRHASLEEAFACHQDELLGMLYHMVGNAEDARDAFQDAFVKCWRRRDSVAEVQNLKAWIFRVALNTCRDMRQTAWRRKKRALPDDESSVTSHYQDPVQAVEYHEQLSLVRQAVGQLRAEEREVFLLRQNAQMTYEEIAEALEIPTGTVKTRMRLALNRLRTSLQET